MPSRWQDIKTPPVSFFVKRALGKQSGSQKPGHESAGTLSLQHVYEIANIKQLDHPGLSLNVAVQQHHWHMPEHGREHCQAARHADSIGGNTTQLTRHGWQGCDGARSPIHVTYSKFADTGRLEVRMHLLLGMHVRDLQAQGTVPALQGQRCSAHILLSATSPRQRCLKSCSSNRQGIACSVTCFGIRALP